MALATYGGSSCPNPARKVTFRTSDGEEVKVRVVIAKRLRIVGEFFDGDLNLPEVLEDAPFPLPAVKSVILRHSVRFLEGWEKFDLKREALENEREVVLPSKYEALERKRLFELPSKYQALERERLFELPSKYEALEREKVFELPSKYQALERERQEFKAEFFGPLTDDTIVELVKAADYLEIKELLDSVMPSFRNRFGFGDDKDAAFVHTAEAEAIFRWKAALASEGGTT